MVLYFQLLLGSAVVPLDFAKNGFVQGRNKPLWSDFLHFLFEILDWHNSSLRHFPAKQNPEPKVLNYELVNNLVQITFSIQSLRQSINMEDSLYLVDFFFPVCICL